LAPAACGAGNEWIAPLLRRAAVYASLSPLHEALFGLGTGKAEHATAGLTALRRMIK
jgi:hypothetical protein